MTNKKTLVRPFAMPRPTRRIYIVTRTDFIRHTLLNMLIEKIKACIPKEMLTLQNGTKSSMTANFLIKQ